MSDPDSSHTGLEREIEQLEKDEAAARVRGDVAKLESLWSDDLLINATENIIYTKSHFIVRIKAGQVMFRSFDRTISRMAVSENVAVTTGNESIVPDNGADAGKSVYCSYMNVWTRGGGRWQMIGRQVAVIARASSNTSLIF